MKLSSIIVTTLGLIVLAVAVSGFFSVRAEPYRCFQEMSLNQLIEAEDFSRSMPPEWRSGVSSRSSIETKSSGVSDAEHEVLLALENPQQDISRLCSSLRAQLESRCNVRNFLEGAGHCSAEVISPGEATTTVGGVYKLRPSRGRLHLRVIPDQLNLSKVVLTSTEWAN